LRPRSDGTGASKPLSFRAQIALLLISG